MNPRSAQVLTASLAALLVILVGATVFVLLSRPTSVGPTPTPGQTIASPSFLVSPTPTLVASASPSASVTPTVLVTPTPSPTFTESPSPSPSPTPTESPSATASESPSPTPTESPSPSPTPTESPSPSPTPTATPSPTPTPTPIVPTAPQREIRIATTGLDDKALDGSVPRILTFEIDGPSLLHAAISDASGLVQLCVWREDVNDERMCDTGNNVVLERTITDAGNGLWHVSMIGGKGVTPTAALTVDFNAANANVQLDNFRYRGTSDPNYNGFRAGFDAGNGELKVQFTFDDGDSGGSYDYHVVVQRGAHDPLLDETGGPSTSFVTDPPLNADAGKYSVTVEDPDEVSNPGMAVFITAVLSWQ